VLIAILLFDYMETHVVRQGSILQAGAVLEGVNRGGNKSTEGNREARSLLGRKINLNDREPGGWRLLGRKHQQRCGNRNTASRRGLDFLGLSAGRS